MPSLSPSASHDREQDDDGPAKKKRRKARPKVSCIPCQRRKTKCEETEFACNQCEKRNEADRCVWDTPVVNGPVPNDIAVEFGALKRRMATIERNFEKLRTEHAAIASAGPVPQIAAPAAPLPPLPPLQSPILTVDVSPAPLPRPSLPTSSSFSPFGPAVTLPKTELSLDKKVEAETEDAAQALESLALPVESRLTNLKPPPVAATPEDEAAATAASPLSVQPGAFTTILLGPEQQTSPTLLEHLPHPETIQVLIDHFFAGDLSFIYLVLHRQTFRAECAELVSCVARKETARIDPAFLAIFYMVLTWAASTIGPIEARKVGKHVSVAELKALPEVWLEAFESSLQASQWAERPQVRVAQAIMLKVAYTRTPPHGVYLGLETPSFFIWLGAAIRIAQLLGLHKLGSDPHTMPRDHEDPAWPVQPCSLKREMAKRIWHFGASLDQLFATRVGMGSIGLGTYDTDMPLNVDDADLGLDVIVKERPPTYLSDSSFCRMKIGIALHTARQFTADPQGDIPYELVLDIGANMRKELKEYERYIADSCPHRRPYHRTLLLLVQQNRILRLHRPFFMRGWTEPQYATSTEDAMSSASAICTGLNELRLDDGNLEHVWFVWAYGLSAVFVVYVTMLREERKGPTAASQQKRKLLSSARSFYARGAQGDASTTVREISLQAVQVIDALLLPRGASHPSSSQSTPSAVAAIFLKIASVVQPPTATRPSSPVAGSSTSQLPQTERYALDGAISSLLSLAPYHYNTDAYASAPFTTTNLSDHHHPHLSLLGSTGVPPLYDLHFGTHPPHAHHEMMAQVDGNVFNEENVAAREFLANFSGSANGSTPGLPGVTPHASGAPGPGGEWDLSELVGPEWL